MITCWNVPINPIVSLWLPYRSFRASLVTQMVKNLSAMQETWVQFLGWEDPLEKAVATHSSILAWRIPWTEELGRIQSMGSQMTEQLSTSMDHSASWLAFCPSLSWILHCSCWRKGKSLSSLRWKDWCPCQVRDPIVWSNELADWRVLRIMVCLPAPHGSLQRPFWFHRLVFTEKMSMPKEPLKRWNKALELQMM